VKKKLRITLVQSNLFWENTEKNISHFSELISSMQNTDIILLPEMFNTAFSPSSHHLAEKMNGNTIAWLKNISKENKCAIAGSLMIQEDNKIYNRLIWISKKGEILTYDKRHLFSPTKEHEFLSKGNDRLIVEIDGWKICPLICYDLRFPVFSRNNVGYDVLIYLANWPIKRIEVWDTLLKARSIENQCYTIGVNRVGQDGNGVLFNGHSKVFNSVGKELGSAIENKEDVLQVEICSEDLNTTRKKMNFLKDRDDFILE
tara:strand:- start:1709 stop:2485 length:777 start_codon:yes stop_codon:yes gene_type:complete